MIKIREIPVAELKEYEHNARKNEKAIGAVAVSIEKFGFRVPVIVDKGNVIIAGHTRLKAAIQLGMEKIPAILADDLTEEQINAYRLADNKVAELSSWDFDRLEKELEEIDDDWLNSFFEKKRYEDGQEYDGEIDLSSFDDEEFKYECPECGFKFNA